MQAEAALAQRLQAGGVNGLNGGVLLLCHANPNIAFSDTMLQVLMHAVFDLL